MDGWRLRIIAAAVVRHSETSALLLLVCGTCARLLEIYSRMIPPGIYQMKSTSLYGYGFSKNFKMITPTISAGRGECVVAAGKKK
jgi:hypothetical protein